MTDHRGRPSQRLWVDHFEPLEVWRFPFRLENLLLAAPLIGLWGFLLGSYHVGGIIMIVRSAFGIYATLGFFFCYLFLVLDFTARGFQTPPKISGDILRTSRARFFKVLAVASLFVSLTYTVTFSEQLFVMLLLSTVLFLPVAICIIAIQDSFLGAMNPLRWFGFFRAIRFDQHVLRYLMTLGMVLASFTLLFKNLGWLNLLTMSCWVLSVVLLFRSLGVLVHANASDLGLSVRFGHDIEASQIEENERRDISDFALGLYQQVEVHRINEAFEAYESHLTADKFASEEALWKIIRSWSNTAFAVRVGQGFIERLIKANRLRDAWDVLIYCFDSNERQYRLASGNSTLQLTSAATNTRERLISAELLRFFDKDFPQHPETTAALLKAVELLIADAKDTAGAQKLLQNIRIKFPEAARTRVFQNLYEAIR